MTRKHLAAEDADLPSEDAIDEHDEQGFTAADDDGRERHFPCHNCGAAFVWEPGQQQLACPYCGTAATLPTDEDSVRRAIREHDLDDYLAKANKDHGLGIAQRQVACQGCGAHVELAAQESLVACPFCAGTVIDEEAHDERIRPEALIPFTIERAEAEKRFKRWLARRWFAPSALKREAQTQGFTGIYRPWWTFDSNTVSHWSGYAGHYSYETRSKTVNGKTVTERVRRTRWVWRSGIHQAFFDDILVPGFEAEIQAKGYRLSALEAYQPEALAGFVCERYSQDPVAAWPQARQEIESSIRSNCRQRLGGDTQRGLQVNTAHSAISYKSLLLPAWHSSYRFGKRSYPLIVNGQTGQISARRPWSWVKIGIAVLILVVIITLAVLIVTSTGSQTTSP